MNIDGYDLSIFIARSYFLDKRRWALSQAQVRSTSQRLAWRQKFVFVASTSNGFSTRLPWR